MKYVFLLQEGTSDPVVFETVRGAELEANKRAGQKEMLWVQHEGNPNKWSDFSDRFTISKVPLFKRGSKR